MTEKFTFSNSPKEDKKAPPKKQPINHGKRVKYSPEAGLNKSMTSAEGRYKRETNKNLSIKE